MTESPSGQNHPESAKQLWPSDEELADFDFINSVSYVAEVKPEDFGYNPGKMTDKQRAEVDFANEMRPRAFPCTFEEYFGYPDPRPPKNDDV